MNCKRPDCRRQAVPGDDYCSTYCCRRMAGTLLTTGYQDTPPGTLTRSQRRHLKNRIEALRDKHHSKYVTAENTDAHNRRVPGSFETGKRR